MFKYTILGSVLLIGLAKSYVFYVEKNVHHMRKQLKTEKEKLNLLKVEWTYLNQSMRLHKLANTYLKNWKPIEPKQFKDIKEIEAIIAQESSQAPENTASENTALEAPNKLVAKKLVAEKLLIETVPGKAPKNKRARDIVLEPKYTLRKQNAKGNVKNLEKSKEKPKEKNMLANLDRQKAQYQRAKNNTLSKKNVRKNK